jgi:hypothetical protein
VALLVRERWAVAAERVPISGGVLRRPCRGPGGERVAEEEILPSLEAPAEFEVGCRASWEWRDDAGTVGLARELRCDRKEQFVNELIA